MTRNPGKSREGSHYRAWWDCSACKKSFQSAVYQRTRVVRATGCPHCAGIEFSPIAETHPELCKEWSCVNDKNPREVTHGSHYRALWDCPACKKSFRSAVRQRTRTQKATGCPFCSMSSYEQIVHNVLVNNGIAFVREERNLMSGKRFDFVVSDRLVIETDGKHHFGIYSPLPQKQQKRFSQQNQ